jgi:hypothetical protein
VSTQGGSGSEDVALASGADLGIGGLGAAIERLQEANRGIASGGGEAPIARALGEALFWIAALDDHFRGNRGAGQYWPMRAADERGRTTGGLIYARNMLGHGLHIAGAIRFKTYAPTVEQSGGNVTVRFPRLADREYHAPNYGTFLSIQMLWADLAALPTPLGPQHGRDEWYRDHVAARPLSQPLRVAREWFERLSAPKPLGGNRDD